MGKVATGIRSWINKVPSCELNYITSTRDRGDFSSCWRRQESKTLGEGESGQTREGKDGVIRGVVVFNKGNNLERPVQLIRPCIDTECS